VRWGQRAIVAAVTIVPLYLGGILASGPWDPWETHYGEVARQMVVRSDPLDLWWQPGNGGPEGGLEKSFASKPALPFWLMALSLRVFGVGTNPAADEMVRSAWVPIALRLPSMLAGFAAVVVLGVVVWRLASPRAGVLSAIVLATMPQWAIVSRQALTDMFFVAPVVLAAAAWVFAWGQADRPLRTRGHGWRELPWDRAWTVFFAVFVVGALVPLGVLHQHSFDPQTWATIGRSAAKSKGLREIQSHMFLYWVIALSILVGSARWRRRSQACMGVLYLATGLSAMGKGLIGPGLIGTFALVDVIVSGRFDRLRRCEIPLGIAIFVLACFPWHHAMVLYRGDRWINELIIQNNLQRFGTGEQDQAKGGIAFYLETLGLAALPWSALLPAMLVQTMREFAFPPVPSNDLPTSSESRPIHAKGSALLQFATIWFAVSLFVVTYSTTKYYHYLVPCLPPAAVLVGMGLDRWLRSTRRTNGVVVALFALPILIAVVRDAILSPAWLAHLTTYLYTGMWTRGAPTPWPLALTCLPFIAGLILVSFGRIREATVTWVLSAVLTTGYVLADYVPKASEAWSQRSALRQYFDERGPNDRLVSWWFYYRGETFFTKGDVWVMQNPNRTALAKLFDEQSGTASAIWFITIESHTKRLAPQLPTEYRDRVEERYRSEHYVLMRVRLD